MTPSARFQRGETIRFALVVNEGTIAGMTLTAALKKAGSDRRVPEAIVPAIYDFTITPFIDNMGWYLTLSADQTEELTQGDYVANGRLELEGTDEVIKTEPLWFWIEEAT